MFLERHSRLNLILDCTEHANCILSGQRNEAIYFSHLVDCFHGLRKFLHKILNCLNVTEYEKALGEGVPVTFETFHVWGIAVYKKITFFQ